MPRTATRTVFLTGATGFVGGAVLAELLARSDARILVLSRSDTAEKAAERVRVSLARFLAPCDLSALAHRCWVLVGDITGFGKIDDRETGIPLLGNRRADDEAPALDSVTHVIHLAASTSSRSVPSVARVNILGSLSLAHRFSRFSRLERFLHVGTAYACGDHPSRIIFEDDTPRHDVNHLVECTRSQAETETLLIATAPELPLVIARTSVVVGHTRLGCGPSVGLFWLYRTMDLLRRSMLPLKALEDVVPVDYVASALCALAFSETLKHRTYHVSAGLTSSVSGAALSAAFNVHHGDRPDDPIQTADIEVLRAERERIARRLGPGDEERLLATLEEYLRFRSLPAQVFDNTRLLAEGIAPPPPFTSYLARCVETSAGRSVYEQMLDDS